MLKDRQKLFVMSYLLYIYGGRYNIETSQLICSANQWTGFYMITASVIKELKLVIAAMRQKNK